MERLKELRLNHIEKANNVKDFDIISLGSETCWKNVPSIEEVKEICSKPKSQIKIVLPFVPQQNLDAAKKYIDTLFLQNKNIIVIFNDLGLLSYAAQKENKNVVLGLGRYFDWSYNWIPWKEDILLGESENIVNFVNSTTLYDRNKISFYKKMNIKVIEIEMSKSTNKIVKWFANYGIDVHVHINEKLVAITRACPCKRIFGESICKRCGENLLKLEFSKKWIPQTSFITNEERYIVDPETNKKFPLLFLKGNIIFMRNTDYSEVEMRNLECSTVIVDDSFREVLSDANRI